MFKKLLSILFISIRLYNSDAFFNPSITTPSNKKFNIVGQGPPLLFSTGLFGTMPRSFYNDLINNIKSNSTIITTDGLVPIVEKDIDDLCYALGVDKIGYLGHSSFFPEVLNNNKIAKAILMDPINLPWISFDGLSNSIIKVDYPLMKEVNMVK